MCAAIIKPPRLRSTDAFLLPFTLATSSINTRGMHTRFKASQIPSPTPFVPDVQTFLSLIGRGLSQHAAKIPSWTALFSLSSEQFKELGVDPPRNRKYLLRWREKFRKGQHGIGGDFKYIKDGVAEVRVAEVPAHYPQPGTATLSPGMRKVVVNVPAGTAAADELSPAEFVPVKGLKIRGAYTVAGPHVTPTKGGKAGHIVIKEGLWEVRRGRKIDGGERRQAEVRAKRRGEEKRAAR